MVVLMVGGLPNQPLTEVAIPGNGSIQVPVGDDGLVFLRSADDHLASVSETAESDAMAERRALAESHTADAKAQRDLEAKAILTRQEEEKAADAERQAWLAANPKKSEGRA